jgi:hypothetical protein
MPPKTIVRILAAKKAVTMIRIFLGPAPTTLNATKIVTGKDKIKEMVGKINPSSAPFLHR